MRRLLTLAGLVTTLCMTGCANQHVKVVSTAEKPKPQMPDGVEYRPDSRDMANNNVHNGTIWLTPKNLYNAPYTHKGLSGYAEQLAMSLMQNARGVSANSLVAVASFVELDKSLQNASVLGNQLAEFMITEVQQYGVSVVDVKFTDGIEITEHGDLVFSRDSWGLSKPQVEYVLSGTLIRNEKGVKVNARIIQRQGNVVVSSASGFIPHFIVSQLTGNVASL